MRSSFKRIKAIVPIIVISFFILMSSSVFCFSQTNIHSPKIKITANKTPLKQILPVISSQTGFKISIDPALTVKIITGRYDGLNAEQFFSRVFKKNNIIVDIDWKNMTLKVYSFTKKNVRFAEYSTHVNSSDDIPFENRTTLGELNAMHKQYVEDMRLTTHDEEIIMGTEMSIAELNAYQQNLSELNEATEEDVLNQVVPGSSLTLAELNELHKQTQIKSNALAKDTDVIIAGSNMTIGELNELHSQQLIKSSSEAVGNALIMGSDMTIAELNDFQNQQRNNGRLEKDDYIQ